MIDLPLRVVGEDATTVTLGWDALAGVNAGYRYRFDDITKKPHTWDPGNRQVRVAKEHLEQGEHVYVEALGVVASGTYPATPVGLLPLYGGATGYEILTLGDAAMQNEVNLWKQAGARYLRTDSTTGNQAVFDKLVAMCQAAGLGVMPVLHGTTGPITDTSFSKAQASKWKGNPTIVGVELCNEPDLNGWTPNQYGKFSSEAAAAIRNTDPSRIVVAGALWTGGGGAQAYVPAMIAHGTFVSAKVLSMHLYDPPLSRGSWSNWDRAVPWIGGFYNGNTARELLDDDGLQYVQIISTESGGPRAKYGEQGQADIVRDALAQATAGKVASVCIYNMNHEVEGFDIAGHKAFSAYQAAVA